MSFKVLFYQLLITRPKVTLQVIPISRTPSPVVSLSYMFVLAWEQSPSIRKQWGEPVKHNAQMDILQFCRYKFTCMWMFRHWTGHILHFHQGQYTQQREAAEMHKPTSFARVSNVSLLNGVLPCILLASWLSERTVSIQDNLCFLIR